MIFNQDGSSARFHTLLLLPFSTHPFLHPFSYTMFWLSVFSNSTSATAIFLSLLRLIAQYLFYFFAFFLLRRKLAAFQTSSSQWLDHIPVLDGTPASPYINPPIFHTLFSNFMLIKKQVLLLLFPLLISQPSHHSLSFLLLPYKTRCSPQPQHFLILISFSRDKDFLVLIMVVYFPEYHSLVLSDVHLCTSPSQFLYIQLFCVEIEKMQACLMCKSQGGRI